VLIATRFFPILLFQTPYVKITRAFFNFKRCILTLLLDIHNHNTTIHINHFILPLTIHVDMVVNDKIEKVDVIVEKNKLTCLDKIIIIINENIMATQSEMVVGKDLIERKVVDSRLMENFGELSEYIMNSKIEVNWDNYCSQLKEMMLKSSRHKWIKPQVTNVCKVIVTKIENFDEAVPIVHVRVGKYGVKDC